MSVLNIEEWTPKNVADWVSGLDESIRGYSTNFINHNVHGKKLLNLMSGELSKFGILRVGDQLLLYDGIQRLRDELESDRVTLQSLALNLAVRCKNYRSELSNSNKKSRTIPTESLYSASYLLDNALLLIKWLTRYPFLGYLQYEEITKSLTKHSFELAMSSQRDSFADNPIEEVQYLCTSIISICERIISLKDLLIFQPAIIDVITLRRRIEQDLGINFETTHNNIHLISGVTLFSPAQQSGVHLEKGDEILQINYQTSISWTQDSIIKLLSENQEIILTVKRRPRDGSKEANNIYLLRPVKMPIRNISSPIRENVEMKEKNNVSDSTTVSEESGNKGILNLDKGINQSTGNDYKIVTDQRKENAIARFWTAYPKTNSIIRRRKSISGSSPIETRPPATFEFQKEKPTTTTSPENNNSSSGTQRKTKPRLDKSKSIQVEIHDYDYLKVGEDQSEPPERPKLPPTNSNDPPPLPPKPLKNSNISTSSKPSKPIVVTPQSQTVETPEIASVSSNNTFVSNQSKPPIPIPQPQPEEDQIDGHIGHVPPRPSKDKDKDSIDSSSIIDGKDKGEVGSKNNENDKNCEKEDNVIHSGFLHARILMKSGGWRWVPYMCTVDKSFLKIRKNRFDIQKLRLDMISNCEITKEFLSRHAFHFNYESQEYIFAAESQIELYIWMRILTNDKSFCRSFSDDKSRLIDKSRRSSLPQTDGRAKKLLSRTLYQSKSLSMGKLSENKRSASGIIGTTTSTSTSEATSISNSKSNISSITITSLKRFSTGSTAPGHNYNSQNSHFQHSSTSTPTSTPVSTHESAKRAFFRTKKIENVDTSPVGQSIRKYPSFGSPISLTRRSAPNSNSPFIYKDTTTSNRNSTSSSCDKCGRKNSTTCNSSTQTESVVILLDDNCESVV